MTAFSPPLLGEGEAALDLALRRMKNSLSVLHITAHPDDEDAHTLTTLARSEGYRVGIYSLTRGESGENAIDHRAYEALGEMRTDELLRAATWYGVEDVYFGPFYDYGYSKRIDEAFEKWGQELLIRELVRAIRAFRPDVVLGRFRGDARDGHAHHQAAGWAAREAFRLAPNPDAYAELGLEPVKPAAYFVLDGTNQQRRSSSLWEAIDSKAILQSLGVSCASVAEYGYAEHRSQTGGKRVLARPKRQLYHCVARHQPHLGEARFGFRESARLGIGDANARSRYVQALEVIETQLRAVPRAASLERAMETLVECAPDAVMRSRADDLRSALEKYPRFARAFSDHREEPTMFFQKFPTLSAYPQSFSLEHVPSEETSLHLHGEAQTASEDDATHVEFTDAAHSALERPLTSAIYIGDAALLPHAAPSCIVQTSHNSNTSLAPAVARSSNVPHTFEIVRRGPLLPQGRDLRIAGPPPDEVVGSVPRKVWYIPGYGECYADALRAMHTELSQVGDVPAGLGPNDVLLIGFRAYHRHPNLTASSERIAGAFRAGATIVVMAQSTEYKPERDAPHPGELREDAPEACEEERSVRLLEPEHALFSNPHPIDETAFENWFEQYGSKFWTGWSDQYQPLIACADLGEPEQHGVLLTVDGGAGRYTYCALALHIQLTMGHAGAYKLFANLLQA